MSQQQKEAFITYVAGLLVRNGAYGEAALAGTRTIDGGETADPWQSSAEGRAKLWLLEELLSPLASRGRAHRRGPGRLGICSGKRETQALKAKPQIQICCYAKCSQIGSCLIIV